MVEVVRSWLDDPNAAYASGSIWLFDAPRFLLIRLSSQARELANDNRHLSFLDWFRLQ